MFLRFFYAHRCLFAAPAKEGCVQCSLKTMGKRRPYGQRGVLAGIFFRSYRARNSSCRSYGSERKYALQPGQKLICQRQMRPNNDPGSLSYRARKRQCSHMPAMMHLQSIDIMLFICQPWLLLSIPLCSEDGCGRAAFGLHLTCLVRFLLIGNPRLGDKLILFSDNTPAFYHRPVRCTPLSNAAGRLHAQGKRMTHP